MESMCSFEIARAQKIKVYVAALTCHPEEDFDMDFGDRLIPFQWWRTPRKNILFARVRSSGYLKGG